MAAPKRPTRPAAPLRAALPALPPAVTAALAAFVGLGIVLTVTFPIYDSDLWQHLLVGKAIWLLHRVPTTELWSWPTYGAPDVLPSWIFRVLLWPVWKLAGVPGLFAWRWAVALLVFGLLWRTARVSGAKGAMALFALFWCALFFRYRSQPRPDGLVMVLIAAQLLVLESRRARDAAARGLDPAWALVPIALVWANLHLSYWIGFALTTFYLADSFLPARTGFAPRSRGTLALAFLASIAVSFANPVGWRALAQPFEYWFVWRHEPIYQIIGELRPVVWSVYSKSLLPLWLPLLALVALRRWRRRGFDLAQALVIALFVPQALASQRFLGYAAVLVGPFFARDLDEWWSESPWPAALRAPWAQAAMAAGLSAIAWLPTLTDSALRPGWGLRMDVQPVAACDWLRDHDVRGRGFNPFEMGGYLLYRFWPDKPRMPFMDIHQAGTHEDRALAVWALMRPESWAQLDRKYRFDWVLLFREQYPGEHVLDTVDADTTTWALVFRDDEAALFLRRDGAMADLAARERFRVLPAGPQRFGPTLNLALSDTTVRRALRSDLERSLGASRWNGDAESMLAYVDLMDGRAPQARARLEHVLKVRPGQKNVHQSLGTAWLVDGHAREALAEFELEKRTPEPSPNVDLRMGQALQALGRAAEARAAYTRALASPGSAAEARDSLAVLDRR